MKNAVLLHLALKLAMEIKSSHKYSVGYMFVLANVRRTGNL